MSKSTSNQIALIAAQLTETAMKTGTLTGTVPEVSKYFKELYEELEDVIGTPREVTIKWQDSEAKTQ